jgi:putative nucleotidyltransferase with HDIG domain
MTCAPTPFADLVRQLQAADPSLITHGAAVARLSAVLGRRLGIAGERLDTLRRAALLHDIGKRYVPREVLDKAGPLLAHERQLVEAHPAVGATMLLQAGLHAEAAIVRNHHERWDGTGYPDRLRGDAIPLESRIIQVADTFDAMTSDRPYRAAIPRAVALDEIEDVAGSQLDPRAATLVRDAVSTCGAPARVPVPAPMRDCGRHTAWWQAA